MSVISGKYDEVDRVPCINTVSVATIEFMQATEAFWPDAHFDPEKMAKLAAAAHKLCGLDMITVPFDMTLEAELRGAKIE